jgi:hypothetical protein
VGRHRMALEWLLDNLRTGAPVDRSRWPDIPTHAQAAALTVPAGVSTRQQPEKRTRQGSTSTEPGEAEMRDVLARWKEERACYPGWRL